MDPMTMLTVVLDVWLGVVASLTVAMLLALLIYGSPHD